ncbi:MAG: hypothetical protein JWN38_480 [Candidatus Saccharibacteria bacterium]|nr:hypothetical protein [Candidatus Saccharibacteria bacterium]
MLLLIVLLVVPSIKSASADVNSCAANLTPNSVQPNSQTALTFTVTNNGPDPVIWLLVQRPSSDFVINGASWGGSYSGGDDNLVLFDGTPIESGDSLSFGVSVHADNTEASSADWTVLMSDDPNGSGAVACSGNLGLAIAGPVITDPDVAPPVISDLQLSRLTSTSVVLSWTTDEPTTTDIAYGQNTNFGLAKHDAVLKTQHSMPLQGLTPDASYHYQVSATDSSGNVATSGDGTFLTPLAEDTTVSTPSQPVATTSTVKPLSTPIAIKAVPTEHIAPTISLASSFAKPYKVAPRISGVAADNEALAGIEYSTDDGHDWLPVDTASGLGSKAASFSFTPQDLDDGNYPVLARAIDTSGNIGSTAAVTLVIDRLDPLVGGNIVNVGPQVLAPRADGTLQAQQNVDQKITLSAVGGPTSITLQAATTIKTKKGEVPYMQSFSLTHSEETGLWSGVLGFNKTGVYTLTAESVDGAGNKASRSLNEVDVASPGHTLDAKTKAALTSTVTAYYLEPESHSWVVWDGAAYGQRNPQKTDTAGSFSLFLPPGTYYLQAKAAGYQTVTGSIFTLHQSTPVSTNLLLHTVHEIRLGKHTLAMPSLSIQHTTITSSTPKKASTSSPASLVGKQAPDFKLVDTTGATIQAANLLGRPTIMSFETTWSPLAAQTIATLSKLQANPDINVVPVALQENSSRVEAYTAIADVRLRWLVDPDSTLSAQYNVQGLPLHYFIDRKGVVRSVVVGVLTEQQMLDGLAGL